MQFNDKEEIKGDFEVDARGSSTLLVKETQTQALVTMMQLAESPVFGPLVKHAELFRKVAQAQHITPHDVIVSDEEIKAMEEAQAQQAEEPPLEIQLKQMDIQAKLQIAEMNAKIEMMKLEMHGQASMAQLEGKLTETQVKEDNKANMHMSEMDYAVREGKGI
jgi:hypothetical protein